MSVKLLDRHSPSGMLAGVEITRICSLDKHFLPRPASAVAQAA